MSRVFEIADLNPRGVEPTVPPPPDVVVPPVCPEPPSAALYDECGRLPVEPSAPEDPAAGEG